VFLFARAMRLARSHSDAWDLVQDTYERALRGQSTFQPGTNLRLWLMTIMYNLFLDKCRKQTREPRVVAIDEGDIPTRRPRCPSRGRASRPSRSTRPWRIWRAVPGGLRAALDQQLQLRRDRGQADDSALDGRDRLLRARQKLKSRLLDVAAA
jgi:DNA-directed RNA polymerase specialized sigma24 family protein